MANNRKEDSRSALSFREAGGDVLFLAIHPFFWLALLAMIESGWFKCCRSKDKKVAKEYEELDDDVKNEQTRVENESHESLAVKAEHMRKNYGDTVAVKDICFALEFGD